MGDCEKESEDIKSDLQQSFGGPNPICPLWVAEIDSSSLPTQVGQSRRADEKTFLLLSCFAVIGAASKTVSLHSAKSSWNHTHIPTARSKKTCI